jgi:HlyD family secretion protein
MRRYIVPGAIAVAVVAVLFYAFRPQPLLVDTAVAERGALQVTVEEEARTRLIDRFVVSAPVAGYLQRITLRAGDAVRAGVPLLVIEPMPSEVLDARTRAAAEARVAAAQAALHAAEEQADAAQAGAELAQAEFTRIARLYENRQVSAELSDRSQAEARRSAATLRAARHAVEVARYELEIARTALAHSAAAPADRERIVVSSPVDGRVLRLRRESEGVVARAEPLLEIGDPRALEVVAEVLSDAAVRIAPGTRVLLQRWGGEGALEARVHTVEPSGFTKISALGVEEQRVLIIADLVSPPAVWAALGDGYRVEARFVLWEADDVLQIPASALFRSGDGWSVFVIDGDRVHLRHITVGQRGGLRAQVLDGLREGERLVIHPDQTLRDGTRIVER